MIAVALDALAKPDIDELVASRTPELRTLEYKSALPGNSDADKREFLSDVSSFANAGGGHLLYGVIGERDAAGRPTGIAASAPGLTFNHDAEQLRIENMMRDGIDPRIVGVGMRCIDGFTDGSVLVIHVPSSFNRPHMVTFGNLSRFFSRNSAGKYQLDVGEIRSAFAASESVPQAIRRFREERLGRIISGETPVPLEDAPKLVMHLYPLSAALSSGRVATVPITTELSAVLGPLGSSGYNHRYNFDGYVTYSGGPPARAYTQLFRDGCIEATTSRIAYPADPPMQHTDQIPSPAFENVLAEGLRRYGRALSLVGIAAPVSLMVSLLGVQGHVVATDSRWWAGDMHPIERDALIFPDLLVDTLGGEPRSGLQPISDMLWQASGASRSPHYDDDGAWVERRR